MVDVGECIRPVRRANVWAGVVFVYFFVDEVREDRAAW